MQNILQFHTAMHLIDKNKNIKFFCDLKKMSQSLKEKLVK